MQRNGADHASLNVIVRLFGLTSSWDQRTLAGFRSACTSPAWSFLDFFIFHKCTKCTKAQVPPEVFSVFYSTNVPSVQMYQSRLKLLLLNFKNIVIIFRPCEGCVGQRGGRCQTYLLPKETNLFGHFWRSPVFKLTSPCWSVTVNIINITITITIIVPDKHRFNHRYHWQQWPTKAPV